MEALNLQQLSLILDQDIVILQEDVQQYLMAVHSGMRHGISSGGIPETVQEATELAGAEEYTEEVNNIMYEGNFEKGILVVFQGNSLDSNHREFLLKVLGAVGCSLKDVALVSTVHVLELPPESINQLNPHKCLVFGTFNHPIMKFKSSHYEIVSGETEYFFADALEDLAENVQLKRSLWSGLQVLFQIKK